MTTASEGACGKALIGTKHRHSVVLRVLPTGRLFVIGGSSIEHERPKVVVELRSPTAIALKLVARTFFYANNTASIDPSAFAPYGTPCPPKTFHALLRLVGLKS